MTTSRAHGPSSVEGPATAPRLRAVHEHMLAAVSPSDAHTDGLYGWLRYHLGWADPDGQPAALRAGKGVRPLLTLIACEAAGGDPDVAVPIASAIELTHEFSLIHDDIEDGDEVRRGRAALWTVCGTAQGVNAGDALFGIARRELGLCPVADDVKVDLQRRYDACCVRLAEGQYLDLSFESARRVAVDAYVDMVRRKTGALLAAAASLGARGGGAGPALADAMARFGEALGVGFQISDDVLGLWGDPAVTGKPVGADLLRKKKSLPVLLAWGDDALGARVDRLYAQAAPDPGAAAEIAEAMQVAGCRDRAVDMATSWGEAALQALEGWTLASGPRAELDALVRRAIDRRS